MSTGNSAIMGGTEYESSGGALTPRSMVTRHWRSGDMPTIRIPLNSRKYPGLYALIDEADYELVSQYQWYPIVTRHSTYAVTSAGSRHGSVRMHRLIAEAPSGMDVDHVDGNGLNNTRGNLRIASRTQNQANTKIVRGTDSRFKGVRRNGSSWRATVWVEGVDINIGSFTSEIAAANAYDTIAILVFGNFAATNKSLGLTEPSDEMGIAEIEAYRTPYSKRSGKTIDLTIEKIGA